MFNLFLYLFFFLETGLFCLFCIIFVIYCFFDKLAQVRCTYRFVFFEG